MIDSEQKKHNYKMKRKGFKKYNEAHGYAKERMKRRR